MLARRSIRRFTAQDVSAEHEEALLDAAFAAPSSNNLRPWHFITVRDHATRELLSRTHRWTGMLASTPLVIAVLGRADDPWYIEDCSAATENVLLTATGLGLGGIWCGIREDSPEVSGDEVTCCGLLGVPVGPWRVLALIGIGHPAGQKEPRTQRQATKVSRERFGRRTR
jgi:nitroreductase